ncbi:MAG TPA: bifunctional riboflavin kinase/FAD synthetase [Kofleriaceae bacterium]
MDVVRGHAHCPAWSGAAVAIGNFDGVHVGHRALIDRAREMATAAGKGTKVVALTFDPHPSAVLTATAPRFQIASLARRLELLAAAGADAVVIEEFTREYAAREAAPFVDEILLKALRARAVVVGYDYTYGRARSGSTETLCTHTAELGVPCAVVPPIEVAGEIASSTKIRAYLKGGELAKAEAMLGRPWDIDGSVVHGAKRGRAIGIPTANIAPGSDLIIAPGIYAVTMSVEGGPERQGVASLGTNPTFVTQGGLVLEVHLLDFDGDLYNRHVRTTFVARLRDEVAYTGVEPLLAQIRHDIVEARAIFAAR